MFDSNTMLNQRDISEKQSAIRTETSRDMTILSDGTFGSQGPANGEEADTLAPMGEYTAANASMDCFNSHVRNGRWHLIPGAESQLGARSREQQELDANNDRTARTMKY